MNWVPGHNPQTLHRHLAVFCAVIFFAVSDAYGGDTKHIFQFEISFTKETMAERFSGRVVIFLSKYAREPRYSDDWFSRVSVISARFSEIAPGERMWIADTNSVGYPVPPSEMERGNYFVQAVLDLGLSALPPGRSPGNLYSDSVPVAFGSAGEPVALVCSHRIERVIKESAWSKLVRVESPRLTAFHGKTVFVQGKVHLPELWEREPERRFPLVLFIPGSGFSLEDHNRQSGPSKLFPEEPAVILWLEAYGPDGHGEFANSRNYGPWGEALVHEFIPEVERRFRCFGHREARMIRGHSAGGGAALRLMLNYPDFFGYAWASSPSPVDYRDLHGANIYEPGANLFYDSDGDLRPVVQVFGSRPVAYFKEMSDRDEVLGRGFVLESICSKRGPDGRPERLWDRKTGAVNPDVAADWRGFDTSYQLTHRWKELKDKLSGRLFISVGESDEVGLAGPVKRLQKDLAAVDASVAVVVGPGGHFGPDLNNLPQAQQPELFDRFRQWRKLKQVDGSQP